MPFLSDGAGALTTRPKLEPSGSRRAAYSDIDHNGHVNNARYIQWIQDMLDESILNSANRFRIDINYLAEIRPQETISLWNCDCSPDDEGAGNSTVFTPFEITELWAFEGKHGDSDQSAFRAELRCGA